MELADMELAIVCEAERLLDGIIKAGKVTPEDSMKIQALSERSGLLVESDQIDTPTFLVVQLLKEYGLGIPSASPQEIQDMINEKKGAPTKR